MEHVRNVNEKMHCRDCGKELKVKNDKIINGFALVYDDKGEKIKTFKCIDCFNKNPALCFFKKCEVYSRVVGYIRPVTQWNKGKKEEYKDRQEFQIGNQSCC
jgi:ribonucleoside-triphosphate reductase